MQNCESIKHGRILPLLRTIWMCWNRQASQTKVREWMCDCAAWVQFCWWLKAKSQSSLIDLMLLVCNHSGMWLSIIISLGWSKWCNGCWNQPDSLSIVDWCGRRQARVCSIWAMGNIDIEEENLSVKKWIKAWWINNKWVNQPVCFSGCYLCLCVFVCKCVSLCLYLCVSLCLCVCLCVSLCLFVSLCVVVSLCVWVCRCVSLCLCVWRVLDKGTGRSKLQAH